MTRDEAHAMITDEMVIKALHEYISGDHDTPEQAMRAALTAANAAAWRPIETAPRDGAEIWAFNGEQNRMRWISGDGYALWVYSEEVLADVDPDPEQPTHWQPLPAPPPQQEGK